jgi:streptogramin lyase
MTAAFFGCGPGAGSLPAPNPAGPAAASAGTPRSALSASSWLPSNFASLPADGASHTFTFPLRPQDFGDASAPPGSTQTYAHPITLTLAETGSSGHSTLLLNGVVAGTTATVTNSSQTVALRYDGRGSVSYTTLTTTTSPGFPAYVFRVSPLYIAPIDIDYTASDALLTPVVIPGTGLNAYLDADEVDAPVTVRYTATPSSGCAGVAAVSMSGRFATVTGGPTPALVGVCNVTISDGTSSVTTAIENRIAGPTVVGPLTVTTYWPPENLNYADYTSVTRGPDAATWFWEDDCANGPSNPSSVTRVATSGAITRFPAPSGQCGYSIAAGSDGNLWVTDTPHASIDRVTTGGAWTDFPINDYPNGPLCITAGADGNLWFEESGARVGRITPAGAITWFPLPSGYSFFFDFTRTITIGPDGNVWFAASPDAVGRITTSGVITMFPQPAGSGPNGITFGPDGNVWFTVTGGISKITPAGAVTTFPLSNLAYGALTAGADGNLWVVANYQLLAKVTVNGAVTEYAVPNFGQIGAIASGSDGNLWIAGGPDFVKVKL